MSLDTLHIDRFRDIARRDAFSKVLEGIRAAEEAGLWPIKLNMVVMKGQNDDEVVDFARLAREKAYDVRFIEFMPLDGDNAWSNDLVVPSRRLQEAIEDQFPLQPVPAERPGPAASYRFADGAPGDVGFISSVSQAFCATCNRIRLTAEGGLRTCLFSLGETPLRDLMREWGLGRPPGRRDRDGDLAQGRGSPDQSAGVHEARQVDVADRRLSRPIGGRQARPVSPSGAAAICAGPGSSNRGVLR